jgi:hypothetical protein
MLEEFNRRATGVLLNAAMKLQECCRMATGGASIAPRECYGNATGAPHQCTGSYRRATGVLLESCINFTEYYRRATGVQ